MPTTAPSLSRLRELSQSLETAEHELVHFFNFSPDLMAVVDFDGSFMHVNRAWEKLLGWADVRNINLFGLFHSDDEQMVRSVIGDTRGDVVYFSSRVLRSDHKFIVVDFSLKKHNNRFNLVGRQVHDSCVDCTSNKLQRR
mgnify:FL=1